MSEKKRRYLAAFLAAVVTILLFSGVYLIQKSQIKGKEKIKIGFVFDGDGATPYTANFMRAIDAVNLEFEKRVEIEVKHNVPYTEAERVIKQLANGGCDLIFTNSFGYGEIAKKVAENYPEVQFCQATCANANESPVCENYHTFMGEIYEGRYIAGKIAGLKLNEMIKNGVITEEEALVGYVGAYPYAEVISGYTAFFLGVRSECSVAKMRVRYTNAWTAYALEKEMAEKMIEEGCVIISQHSDTIGPAVACENAEAGHPVYHVGYNQDMVDVAPTTSLIGTRINWSPYICAAVKAVLEEKEIESVVKGHINGKDAGAGFDEGWVQMLELNRVIAAEGSDQVIEDTIRAFEKGDCEVFRGDYVGVDPENEKDTYDLNKGYEENKDSSAPTFHYVLKDVITVEE